MLNYKKDKGNTFVSGSMSSVKMVVVFPFLEQLPNIMRDPLLPADALYEDNGQDLDSGPPEADSEEDVEKAQAKSKTLENLEVSNFFI